MQIVPLLATANQTLIVTLEGSQWTITLREATGCMICDLNIDGVGVIDGTRVLAGEPIIPFAYLQQGNLVLATADDDLPYWDQFGTTQTLYYLTDAEMAGG